MTDLLKNKWLIGGIIIYLAAFAILFQSKFFPVEETLSALVIIGFFFSTVAWIATKRAKILEFSIDPTTKEMLVLAGYIVFLFLYLIFGVSFINDLLPSGWTENPQIFFVVGIVRKLLIFVVLPFILFGKLFGYAAKDFGFRKEAVTEFFKSHLPVVLAVSVLMLLFQYFIGNGAAPVRNGEFSSLQILSAVPLSLIVLFFEVGLVKEFFYRVVLQSRIAAFFKSEVAGIVVMSIVFAISHAPGMVFRQAGVVDGLDELPNPWEAIAYTISTISLISIMFGIIWVRTRNLFALMFIHAAIDLLPNLSEFIRVWKL